MNAFLLCFHLAKLYYRNKQKVLRLSHTDAETYSRETGLASGGRSAPDALVT